MIHYYCRGCSVSVWLMVLGCVCLFGFSLRLKGAFDSRLSSSSSSSSCQQCLCDCSFDSLFPIIPSALPNGSVSDCGKDDPEMSEELRKNLVGLTVEELGLHKIVANDTLERTETLISQARVASSHFQREAEKCNAVVGTCEEARERAEAQLVEERRLSASWEERARELGWGSGDARLPLS